MQCYNYENAPLFNTTKHLDGVEDMKAGDTITEDNVRSVHPGYGLHPKFLSYLTGEKVNRDLKKGERFQLAFV